jgi:hypothetical protein
MPEKPYTVLVVVDRGFGERLANLPPGVPTWVVDSEVNTPVAHRLWKERPEHNHLTGVTTFKGSADLSPEDLLLDELDTIDLHHGPYSANPPYTRIEIFGVSLTDSIKNALAEYGFDSFQSGIEAFSAVRSLIPNRS